MVLYFGFILFVSHSNGMLVKSSVIINYLLWGMVDNCSDDCQEISSSDNLPYDNLLQEYWLPFNYHRKTNKPIPE